jgi:hypothetical protein
MSPPPIGFGLGLVGSVTLVGFLGPGLVVGLGVGPPVIGFGLVGFGPGPGYGFLPMSPPPIGFGLG